MVYYSISTPQFGKSQKLVGDSRVVFKGLEKGKAIEGTGEGTKGGTGCTREIHTLLMGCSKVAREPVKSNFLWLFLV